MKFTETFSYFCINTDGTVSSDIYKTPASPQSLGREYRELIAKAKAEEAIGIIEQYLLTYPIPIEFKNKRIVQLCKDQKVCDCIEKDLNLDSLTIAIYSSKNTVLIDNANS